MHVLGDPEHYRDSLLEALLETLLKTLLKTLLDSLLETLLENDAATTKHQNRHHYAPLARKHH